MTDEMVRNARVAPVTDDVIQYLADEAETGYDTAALRRKGTAGPSDPPPPESCQSGSTPNSKTH